MTTRRMTMGAQTRDKRTGKLGSRAFVSFRDTKWQAFYEFDTHGLSAEETSARVEALEQHHAEWSTRMSSLQALVGVEIVIDTRVYRIVDCTMPGRGDGQTVTLVVGVRRVRGNALEKVEGFPVQTRYNRVSEVPSNERIIDETRQRLAELNARREAHNAYKDKVNALLLIGRE